MDLRRFLVVLSILALAAAACSWSVDLGTSPLLKSDVVPTMVAQTLEALRQQSFTPTPTSTPPPTATATPPNTPVPSILSVSAATNCYAGPSSNYGRVITIYPGTTVSVTGRDLAGNYWVIEVPGYPGTVCWLSGQYAKVTGDTGSLPAPATPLASRYTLSEPRNLRVSCSSEPDPDDEHDFEWAVVFRWTNTEPDQTGVRVFRNNRQIATLGSHASSYTDFFFHRDRHRGVTYGVQVLNSSAVSSIVTINVRHCD